MTTISILAYTAMYSIVPPVIAGGFFWKRLSGPFKILAIYVFVSMLMEAATYVTTMYRVNNVFLMNLYAPIQFAFISLVYARASENVLRSRIIKIAAALFVLGSLANYLRDIDSIVFNSVQKYVEGIVIIAWSIFHFSDLLKKSDELFIERNPMFWLASGHLVYFAGTSILFLFANSIFYGETNVAYWYFHLGLTIILNLVYTLSLWLESRRK